MKTEIPVATCHVKTLGAERIKRLIRIEQEYRARASAECEAAPAGSRVWLRRAETRGLRTGRIDAFLWMMREMMSLEEFNDTLAELGIPPDGDEVERVAMIDFAAMSHPEPAEAAK